MSEYTKSIKNAKVEAAEKVIQERLLAMGLLPEDAADIAMHGAAVLKNEKPTSKPPSINLDDKGDEVFSTCSQCEVQFQGARYRFGGKVYCEPCGDVIANQGSSRKGQNFASVATVRAALFDVLDSEDFYAADLWEGDFDAWAVTEEEASVNRGYFVDAIIARIAELQNPPHDGVNLKRLCSRHAAIAIDPDTKLRCVQCEKERAHGCAECCASAVPCGSFMAGWVRVTHVPDCRWAAVFAPTGEHLVFRETGDVEG